MRIVLFLSVVVFLLGACGGKRMLEQERVLAALPGEVSPQPIVAENGKVAFDYTVAWPAKSFARTQTVKITPVVRFGDQAVELPPCYVQGQGARHTDFPVVKHRQPFELTRHYEMAWQPGMENAQIYTLTEISRCGKWQATDEALAYNGGMQPPVVAPVAVAVENPVVPKADLTGEIRGIIMFPKAGDRIISGQDYMKYLRRNLDTAMAYPGAQITSIEIIVSCSPDGPAAFNQRLGEARYQVARAYFDEQLGMSRFAAWSDSDIYSYRVIVQNWTDLYYMLEDSNIRERYDLIKRLKEVGNRQREQLLVTDMNRYPVIKEQYLPSLRNAQIIIKYKTPWHEVKPTVVPGMW